LPERTSVLGIAALGGHIRNKVDPADSSSAGVSLDSSRPGRYGASPETVINPEALADSGRLGRCRVVAKN
jgi:hypothetical protein